MDSIYNKFIKQDPSAISIFSQDFRDPSALKNIHSKLAGRHLDKLTIEHLIKNNPPDSESVRQNLASLSDKNCRFVITGQQVGLLGGPLLTLYKIVSAVKIAKIFSEELSVPVVPIFWMQSEDHDLKEINIANFLGNSEELISFKAQCFEKNNLRSVGSLALGSEFCQELESFFRQHSLEQSEIISSAYSQKQTLASAFRTLWQKLCSKCGILFFDPLDSQIKSLIKPIIESSFTDHQKISSILAENSAQLKKHGFEEQVKVRKDSPLFFMELNSQRHRLTCENEQYKIADSVLSFNQIKNLIENKTEIFTSSALIRPIVQDSLFPNLVYICGPSEFNYWAQLKELYQFFALPQPLVIPRCNFRLIENKYLRILNKSGFDLSDIELPENEVLNKLSLNYPKPDDLFAFGQSWMDDLEHLKSIFSPLDQNLTGPLEQTKNQLTGSLSRLKIRYQQSLKLKESNSFKQLERVRKVLLPSGQKQERTISAVNFLLKYQDSLFDKLDKLADPVKNFETIDVYL